MVRGSCIGRHVAVESLHRGPERPFFLRCESHAWIAIGATECWRCESHGVQARTTEGRLWGCPQGRQCMVGTPQTEVCASKAGRRRR